ncbi:Hsp70 family protein [Pontibacillus salipaludis]|uniref:Hsp70 family protein n=1 Tax=Pontibacillus salipaludis TaxID=1697394 RepID=UPI0031EE9604
MDYTYKLGIDFGTTTSSVALRKYDPFLKQHQTVVFDLEPFSYSLPKNLKSAVCFGSKDEVWVGQDAVIESSRNDLSNQLIQRVKWYLDQDLRVFYEDYPSINSSITPVRVVTVLFKAIIETISDEVNINDLGGVVLGVPVGYSDVSKKRLIEALWQSGFYKSLKEAETYTEFVSEPIAVALKYREKITEEHRVLVYDHGGGSLDVSVLDLINAEDGIEPVDDILSKETLTMAGEDFTEDLFVHVFLPYYGFEQLKEDLQIEASTPHSLWRNLNQVEDGIFLAQRLEEAKITLSKKQHHRLKFDKGHLRVDLDISREDFSQAIASRMGQIEDTINRALQPYDSREIQVSEIDYVLLAGGSSQIPAIRSLLANKFGKEKLPYISKEDTFLSIVEGLSIAGVQSAEQRSRFDDVVDSNYGIFDEGQEKVSVIVSKGEKVRNTQIQKMARKGKFKTYKTVAPNQSYIVLDVYQDELKIGTIDVPIVANSGDAKFDIYLEVDRKQGILTVEVFEKFTSQWIKLGIEEKQLQLQ